MMPINVMLVDDSVIIRKLFTRALEKDPEIRIIATASDGKIAIDVAKEHQPDILVLDIEMPNMDGITALPLLLKAAPAMHVIMVSTLTTRNAGISLRALELGASDYIPKPEANAVDEFCREIIAKIKALAGTKKTVAAGAAPPPAPTTTAKLKPVSAAPAPVHALAIASSTGGPAALLTLFESLKKKKLNVPIFITQHMPPVFTTTFAANLANTSGLPCAEGKEGETPKVGHVYIAPGGYHMVITGSSSAPVIRLNQEPPVNFCRPAADPMFESLSKIYGKHLFTVVLTGMGRDGADGAKIIVENGGAVIAQDEKTCVVYGMPKAVAELNICEAILPLHEIGDYVLKRCGN